MEPLPSSSPLAPLAPYTSSAGCCAWCARASSRAAVSGQKNQLAFWSAARSFNFRRPATRARRRKPFFFSPSVTTSRCWPRNIQSCERCGRGHVHLVAEVHGLALRGSSRPSARNVCARARRFRLGQRLDLGLHGRDVPWPTQRPVVLLGGERHMPGAVAAALVEAGLRHRGALVVVVHDVALPLQAGDHRRGRLLPVSGMPLGQPDPGLPVRPPVVNGLALSRRRSCLPVRLVDQAAADVDVPCAGTSPAAWGPRRLRPARTQRPMRAPAETRLPQTETCDEACLALPPPPSVAAIGLRLQRL